MSGPASQNNQIPTNWWGYGMPQGFHAAEKAPISSATPVSPMTQVPHYSTSTTVQPVSGGF